MERAAWGRGRSTATGQGAARDVARGPGGGALWVVLVAEVEWELCVHIDHLPVGGRRGGTGGGERRDGPFFRADDRPETLLELLVVDHTGLWAAGG